MLYRLTCSYRDPQFGSRAIDKQIERAVGRKSDANGFDVEAARRTLTWVFPHNWTAESACLRVFRAQLEGVEAVVEKREG
jgi:hypothetical protein